MSSEGLTELLHHELAGQRVVQPGGEVTAVPHQQLGPGRYGFDSVEVDVHAVLTGSQVLFGRAVGRVHVAHPVGSGLVQAVDKVLQLAVFVNLPQEKKKSGCECTVSIGFGKM